MSSETATDLLLRALRDPDRLPSLTLEQWDRLVRQARRADLLARIASTLVRRGLLEQVPPAPRAHFEAVGVVEAAHRQEVLREIAHIEQALGSFGMPIVLLKGAAYLMAGLPSAHGRLFSDVDLLVPKVRLAEVEAALMMQGWATTHHSPYDQRYYRQWMHELPPLRHIRRQTVLDVHHAILPLTARLKPSSSKLLAAARPLGAASRLAVLSAPDMVLHSMTHLFHNDDLSHGLRDLSDLDLLLRHFGGEPEFWSLLVRRAAELDLDRPLYYGLRHAHRILGTPVPDDILTATARAAPAWPLRRLMDALWSVVLAKSHLSAGGVAKSTCLFLLYLRAHWLRMPPLLLVRHLTVKALRKQVPGVA